MAARASSCPNDGALDAFSRGLSDVPQRGVIEAHLAECGLCRSIVGEVLADAVALARDVYDAQHPLLADLLSNLGASYLEAGEFAAAADWLEQAEAAVPNDEKYRLTRASIAGNLGLALRPRDPAGARLHLERALRLTTEAVGPNDERVAWCTEALTQARTALRLLGDVAQPRPELTDWVAFVDRACGE